MSIIEQIEDAIQVHCAWSERLQDAIEGGVSALTVDTALRDNACEFGRWIYGGTIPESAKALHGYDNAVQILADFHKYAGEILELALKGYRDEARRRMGTSSQYMTTSVILTLTLRAWQIDIKSAAGTPL